MPVFFLMGGFLAAQLFARLGPAEFLKHRARRLLVPFAFACVVILPLDLYAWLLGWVVEGRIPLQKLRSLKLGSRARLWGVAHLWFLEYLFVFCAGAVIVQWGWNRWNVRSIRLRLGSQLNGFPLSAFRC
ncbi:MAG: acyltransferase family protein [Planctomycetaceae bacterium]